MNPSFDLDAAFARWRSVLASHDAIGRAEIAELEEHLRESVTALSKTGLSPEEAFFIARSRLGGENLVEELQSAKPARLWAHRARWMFLGVLGFHAISSLLLLIGPALQAISSFVFGPADAQASYIAALLSSALSLAIFIWVALSLAAGRWNLRPFESDALLRRPWRMGLAIIAVVILGRFADRVQLLVAFHNLGSQSVAQLTYKLSFTNWIEPILVLVALVVATHRTNHAVEKSS